MLNNLNIDSICYGFVVQLVGVKNYQEISGVRTLRLPIQQQACLATKPATFIVERSNIPRQSSTIKCRTDELLTANSHRQLDRRVVTCRAV